MKIAYVIHWNEGPRSGVFKKVVDQISEWTRLGHRVTLFLFTSGTGEEWVHELGGGEVIAQSYQGALSRMLDFQKLAQRVRQWKPDVIYHRFDHYYYSLPGLLRGFPSVLEINSNDLTEMRMDKDLRYHFHRLTRALVLRAAAGSVFVSRELSEVPEFSRYIRHSIIIGNGICLDDFLVSKSSSSKQPELPVSVQAAANGYSARAARFGETSGQPEAAEGSVGLLVQGEPHQPEGGQLHHPELTPQSGHIDQPNHLEQSHGPHQPDPSWIYQLQESEHCEQFHHPDPSEQLHHSHQSDHLDQPNQPQELDDPSVQGPAADAVQLVFIGSPGQAWHGVDAIAELAKAKPRWSFDIIGVDAAELPEPVPANMIFHGRLARKEYQPLLARADLAIGTLALYRKQMKEASPLKVREYLANGLPVITAYEETDFPEPVPFILQLPNSPGNVRDGLAQIDAFASEWRGKKVPRRMIGHLDTRVKESQRLSYMKLIREKGGRT
ncbi:glycosyltransferase [Paenibacillus sp. SN-8-1]|uniref:glycosyltransferase n=1 Tax=Paenibacillus sp. SN-8-1 TaxID=3435409 RepID=UPI003D9AA711